MITARHRTKIPTLPVASIIALFGAALIYLLKPCTSTLGAWS
jgi:hypothetical protein